MTATTFPQLRVGGAVSSAAHLTLGFLALGDAAPLLVADELGFFAGQGLRVALQLVPGWASVRDQLAFGVLHGAQMLAPMPVAAALGLGGVGADLRVVATLSLHGNALTLSRALWQRVRDAAPDLAGQVPLPPAALARTARNGAGRIRLAVVYPYSSHNYLLRDWLAAGGLDPDRDVQLVVVPPALMVDALARGAVDGFCVGEPWGSHAEALGVGTVVLASAQRWPFHPEKVLGISSTVLAQEPGQVEALVAGVMQAGRWLDDPANRADAARILRGRALALPAGSITRGLAGPLVQGQPTAAPVFHAGAATFPHGAHGAAWLREMQRWGHAPAGHAPQDAEIVWDSTSWRRAAARLGDPIPLHQPAWPGSTPTPPKPGRTDR